MQDHSRKSLLQRKTMQRAIAVIDIGRAPE
jgi:hypothetical protein